jgi:multiple sugar transport system permease protein
MGFSFALPGLALLLVFLAIPFAMAIGLSFTNLRLGSPLGIRWVGLENYTETLGDADFWKAFFNNVWFAAIVVPIQTALALWLAIIINQRIRGIKVFRAIYFAPVVVGYGGCRDDLVTALQPRSRTHQRFPAVRQLRSHRIRVA